MSGVPAGVRAVRLLARTASLLYPHAFRQTHGRAFADVAQHIWEHESARTSAVRATLLTTRVLLTDTVAGCQIAWMAAVRDDRSAASLPRLLLQRAGRWIGGGRQDLALAGRSALRQPGFAAMVVLTLGLGIGVSAASFDALDRTVLRPLPFRDSHQLVMLSLQDPRNGFWTSPTLDLLARWRDQATRLDQIEIYRQSSTVLHAPEGADRLDAIGISGGLAGMLGVRPVAGRVLQPADAASDAPAVAMVTEQTWRARFGGDPQIVGRVVSLGATPRPTTIVGIWPAGARLDMREVPDLITVLPAGKEYGTGSLVNLIARMAPDADAAAVEAELATLMPPTPANGNPRVPDAASPADLNLGAPFVRGVWLVFAGGLGLLVVSLVNAGHLLLARATLRSHELGIRLALGGSQARLLRLFLAEGLLYAALGLVVGVGVLLACERLVTAADSRLFMTLDGAGLGGRALWFIGGVAAAAAMACAAAPLLRSGSRDIRGVIDRASATRTTGRASRAMGGLVVAQAALAVLLVCGAFVMGRTVVNLMAVDSGVAIDQLAAISVAAPAAKYPTPEARAAYLLQVEDALRSMPGVSGVTTSGMPLLNSSIQSGLPYLDGEAKPEAPDALTALGSVPLNYFEVTGMRLVAGRLFRDDDDTRVAVVNESFARSRGGDVIGRRVFTPASQTSFEIVGVVADVKTFGIADTETRYAIWFPDVRRAPDSFLRFFVRTAGDPTAIVGEARRRINAIDPTVPMFAPETGPDVVRRQTSMQRLVSTLLGALAALGVGLALGGVYGSTSLGVARRTREIGVRLALGATRERVVRTIVGGGLRPVVIGGLIGVAAAWAALPYVEVLLYGVRPRDPWSTVAALVLVAGAGAGAAWLPALKASRIDPALTLRR